MRAKYMQMRLGTTSASDQKDLGLATETSTADIAPSALPPSLRPTSDLQAAIQPLIAGRRVLDLGSVNHVFMDAQGRRGWMFDFLMTHAASIQGVDVEPEQVARAQAAGYPIVQGDAEIFLAENPVDVVLATDLIEHLSNPGKFMETAQRNLVPGGKLVLSTPNAYCLRELFRVYFGWTNDPPVHPQHVCYYTPTTLRALAARYGFRFQEISYANMHYERVTRLQRVLLAYNRMVCRFWPRFSQTMVLVFEAE